MNEKKLNEEWDIIIYPKSKWLDLKLLEVWRYRDLIILFVKRDFVAQYKQTILGPLWHFVSPIFTMFTYTIIFGNVAKLSTDGAPQLIFYLSGITIWNFFSNTFSGTKSTFISNAGIFGKVYFPRMVSPLATVFSKIIQLGIQICPLICIYIYYLLIGESPPMQLYYFFLLVYSVTICGGLGLGIGIIISSLTTKYRDFNVLVGFGLNLLMYATPVIYPLSSVPEKYLYLLTWNPLSSLVECFRFIFTGVGTFSMGSLLYSGFIMVTVLLLGLIVFNRIEKNFMDTV